MDLLRTISGSAGRRQLESHPHRAEVNIDDIVERRSVATGHGHRHRQTPLPATLEDDPIAPGEAGFGQGEAPEPIAFEGIGAGHVDQKVRGGDTEGPVERGVEQMLYGAEYGKSSR